MSSSKPLSKGPLRSICFRTLFFVLRSLQLILAICLLALVAHLISLYKSPSSNSSLDLTLLLFGSNVHSRIPAELIASIFIPSVVALYLLVTFLVICFAHRGLFMAMMVVDFLCMAGMIAISVCLRSTGATAPGARICAIEELIRDEAFEAYKVDREGLGIGHGKYLSAWQDCQVVRGGFAVAILQSFLFLFSMSLSYRLWKMHVQPEEEIFTRRHSKETFRSSFESHPRKSHEVRVASLP